MRIGELAGQAWSFNALGLTAWRLGDLDNAEKYLAESRERAHEANDDRIEALALMDLGLTVLAHELGNPAAALTHPPRIRITKAASDGAAAAEDNLNEAVEILRTLGDTSRGPKFREQPEQLRRSVQGTNQTTLARQAEL
jgi:hypothetical protein